MILVDKISSASLSVVSIQILRPLQAFKGIGYFPVLSETDEEGMAAIIELQWTKFLPKIGEPIRFTGAVVTNTKHAAYRAMSAAREYLERKKIDT